MLSNKVGRRVAEIDPPRSQALDRDQQILDRLAKIEHKVDSIEQTNAFALRADADRHFAEVKKLLEGVFAERRYISRLTAYEAFRGSPNTSA
jgi:hypothetical protein